MINILLPSALSAVLCSSPSVPPLVDLFVDTANANCATGTGVAGSPVCSIGDAIALAVPGDTIRIAPGTYFENLTLPFDLDLIGTGGASVTTIDGNGGASFTTVITIPAAVTVTIDGLTIRNGFGADGGGIRLGGTLFLSNSTIRDNRAGNGAGTAGLPGSDLTVDDCLFLGNRTLYGYGNGGGINVNGARATISNSTFQMNDARDGAAVSFTGGNPATDVLTITNTTLSGNRAGSLVGGARGGGLFQSGGSLVLSDSTLSYNIATYGVGGGLALVGTEFSITNSTIVFNGAGNTGIIGSAPGGGLYLRSGATGAIQNSTITGNTAGISLGGGIFAGGAVGLITVQNSIIAQNNGNTIYPPFLGEDVYGPIVSMGHNLIGDGGTGFTNGVLGDLVGSLASPLDPQLGPLQSLGGSTSTRPILAGSPALNAGDPLAFEPFDQRGVPRPQGSAPDIGAYESVLSFEELCNGDGGDGLGCTPCPCNNDAPAGTVGGCLNSASLSGQMTRTGSTSLSAGDLRFEARSLPANTAAVLLSGSAVAPNNSMNPCFGLGSGLQTTTLDGLRCIVQGVLRHGVRPGDANGEVGVTTNGWGAPNPFFNFGAFMAGETRYFQVTYRDDLAAVCMMGLNTTQAIGVTFAP